MRVNRTEHLINNKPVLIKCAEFGTLPVLVKSLAPVQKRYTEKLYSNCGIKNKIKIIKKLFFY